MAVRQPINGRCVVSRSWVCALCGQPQSAIVCTTCPHYAQRVREDAAAERECEWLETQRRLRQQLRWRNAELAVGLLALIQTFRLRRRAT